MAGRDLACLKPSVSSLREQLARKTLRNVRLQGHTYVDLREDGKRYIFFCTLCLARCYSDAALFDHLRGNLHKERYATAKVTLIGPNPWPFNDGILFFHNSNDPYKDEPASGISRMRLLGAQENINDLAVVVHGNGSTTTGNGHGSKNIRFEGDCGSDDENMGRCESNYDMVIPGVISKEEVSDLKLRLMGYGRISVRFCESEASADVKKIWCEWLKRDDRVDNMLPISDFAIVTFVYDYDLGKQGLFEDIRSLLPPVEYSDNVEGCLKRKRKSFSDPEDISESESNQCDSSGEDSQASSTATSRMLLDRYDDQLLHSRIIASKKLRRELRRQQSLASERMCDICQHKMLPGKDVATLVNMKTGKLACSSRNVHGAFHVCHTSCLIHWILLCEFEILTNPPVSPSQMRRRSKREVKTKGNGLGKEPDAGKIRIKRNQKKKGSAKGTLCEQICSVFCPDCQGTGINVKGDDLENPAVPLSKMFKYKIKASDARRAWMKCPEQLQNCSTGLAFPSQASDDVQEKVSPMKLLHFYRAEEDICLQSS
ncbi:hypothetical protein Nepgr_000421 [Nepenthes gracilis]|uniref:C2H2-type domain-containing protein n=1 Tax=Nepenthes gracilis TaxID=150966 RepID=A0AAD3P6L3_NEPGR|nr:hypothetical protein Nepgr_000421 [Nepenthes gracilis]